jgi:DNA-3-methyladenine glycosylase II
MHEYRLTPLPPFSFELTASLLSPGPSDHIDVFDGKRYTRLLELDSRMRLALVSSLGSEQRPELIITLMNGSEQDERPVSRVLNRMLGMDFDLGSFYELCQRDPQLYGLSRDHYGLKPVQRLRPFEALALSIVSPAQGAHYLRGSLSSLADAFSYSVAYAGHSFCSFPSAPMLADRKVKDLVRDGVAEEQASQLHSLARLVTAGELDLKALGRRSMEEMLATFASLDGVDRLGAQLTVLYGYGRLDCFPTADPLLCKWIARHVHESDEVDEAAVARWTGQCGDVGGLVATYLYAELLKGNELTGS